MTYQTTSQTSLLTSSSNVNEYSDENCWNNFELIFNTTLNLHAPLRPRSRKESRTIRKPWITMGIKTSLKTKQKLYKQFLKNKSLINEKNYKQYCKKLTHIIEHSERLYFKNQIIQSKSNPKKIWQTIDNRVNIKNKKNKSIHFINEH